MGTPLNGKTPRVGARISLMPGHPHAGKTGKIVDVEQFGDEPPAAVVELDPPHSGRCLALPHDWRRVN